MTLLIISGCGIVNKKKNYKATIVYKNCLNRSEIHKLAKNHNVTIENDNSGIEFDIDTDNLSIPLVCEYLSCDSEKVFKEFLNTLKLKNVLGDIIIEEYT